MALLLKTTYEAYKYARDDLKDPRTADWFLVHSPIPVIFITAMYFFTVKEWLPKFMENRPAYDLRKVLVYYNLLQVVLSGYIVVMASTSLHTLNLTCSPVDYSDNPHAMNFAKLTWFYYMVKVVDLLDTVFFILRKKESQATFLHIYHHFGMFFVGWVGTKYVAGGESVFVGIINSFVHVIMYSYYMFAAWKPEMKETIFKFKKHVTQLQLLQFMTLFCIYFPKLFTDCNFPKTLLIFVVPQDLTMIIMFGDFYYHAYIKGNGKKAQVKDTH
ncbi:very long chain fatty acid elongase 7-like [Atheta coriaria]|uniref:very long chain fatty acid elongase 7-like n=1 Tax=Dalotia coriaria TaxID=877792 RepID=UPI0031F44D6F